MSATRALKMGQAAGVIVGIDRNNPVLRPATRPAPAILDALSCCKAEIIALIRPKSERWLAQDWQAFFDDRRQR